MSSRSASTGFPVENEAFEAQLQTRYQEMPPPRYTGHKGQIDTVLRFLESGELPPESSADGRLALEVITAIYQSGFTGQTVTLPLPKDAPLYTKKGFLANGKHFYEKEAHQK